MLNRIILIGRLTKDPELRYTPSNKPVAAFTLAVDRNYKSADGQKETDFINIVAWNKQAELCANHLVKGELCAIEGRLQIRNYEGKDGVRRTAAEVVADNVRFLSFKNSGEPWPGKQGNPDSLPKAEPVFSDEIPIGQEELPF